VPRVSTIKKARKDQGACDKCGVAIKAGDPYRYWSFRYGGKRKRCMNPACSPRRSDLTQSDKKARIYDAQDDATEAVSAWEYDEGVEALTSILETLSSTIEEVADEYEEAAEHFGGEGENAERAEELRSWQEEVENISSEVEDADLGGDCDECDGEGCIDCPDDCDEGVAQVDCDECGGDGTVPCSVCNGGEAVPEGEDYDPDWDGGEPCVDDHDDHDWNGDLCERDGCDAQREPDGHCNACRDGDSQCAPGEEVCGNGECDAGQVETECETCLNSGAEPGKVPCPAECDEGKKQVDEDEIEDLKSRVQEAIDACPI
jgi:hypothetical protein